MARRELARAVVVLDHLRSDGRTLSRRAGAADELLGSAGGQAAQKFSAQRRGADGALGPTTESLSTSRSVFSGVGTSDFTHVNDLEVRGSAPSNCKPSLALLQSSVVCRDSLCASP